MKSSNKEPFLKSDYHQKIKAREFLKFDRYQTLVVVCLVFGLQISMLVYGAESNSETTDYEKNFLAIFGGATTESRRESSPALGIEYERRLNKTFGIGALTEHTFGNIRATVYAVPLAVHVWSWKVSVAPGFEHGDFGTKGLVRFGVEYEMVKVGQWAVSPQVDFDFIGGAKEHALVFGISVGRGFNMK